MRSSKELLIATKEFASERRSQSWWHLATTGGVLVILVALTLSEIPLACRAAASALLGLVLLRSFIIYHDYQHGAILQNSRLAKFLMWSYGLMMLNPPSVWNRSHNHHHKNNSKTFGASIGSFPIMTTKEFASSTRRQRAAYTVARHPLTILFGYATMFLWQMSLRPFLVSPRKHVDGAAAIVLHIGLIVLFGSMGIDVLILTLLLPLFVASAFGAYLFYAQHNYPDALLRPRDQWSHVDAALNASSFMVMGPVMRWITGNIGYHHVHHLNARIPFYRLPEAMESLEELQNPGRTSLKLRDVAACLSLKLWNPEKERFVGFSSSSAK